MYCRVLSREEGYEYEAKIVSIEEHIIALVQYVGYGNLERVWIEDLSISHGEEARYDFNLSFKDFYQNFKTKISIF